MAWSVYAARRGLRQQQIEAEILKARELSKKGAQDANWITSGELPARRSLPSPGSALSYAAPLIGRHAQSAEPKETLPFTNTRTEG